MIFQTFFLRWLEIPRGSVQVLQIYISLGWLVLLVTSHLWMASPSGPVFVRFQDLKFLAFSTIDLTLKVWMLNFFGFTHPPWKLTWQWKITFFKWLGFSRCHPSFRFFFSFDLLRLSLLRLFGSNPSSPERKSADQIALAKARMISHEQKDAGTIWMNSNIV